VIRRRFATVILAALCCAALNGCASVRAYERERLADRIMLFDTDAAEAARELHWIEAREGSTGGTGGAGGGCACN
jgi:hypothetical protein